tara:strand:+ start:1435 stop:1674 length:240 start_codon:yes stop_codon:yes gene_type:complete
MKNLVSHQTTKETVKVLYRVVMPSAFSNSNFTTLEQAVTARNEIGTNGSYKSTEQVRYWKEIREESTIVRVTETIKRVV